MKQDTIFTPRSVVNRLLRTPDEENKNVCTKIPYKGYEISIAMDSSHGSGDLSRSEIRIYDKDDSDLNVTASICDSNDFDYIDPTEIRATGDALKRIFLAIDALCQTKT